jgi:biofilm protein TabA
MHSVKPSKKSSVVKVNGNKSFAIMIFETLETAKTNPLVNRSSIIQEALEFAQRLSPGHELGRFDLQGNDLYALIQFRDTFPREERKQPETHREYVDLQYCFGGGEIIDWYANSNLTPTCDYKEAEDYQLYERPKTDFVPLLMRPKTFALFFPDDAHVPAVHDGIHKKCHMVVFKIRFSEF